ncbi:kinase-like protein [Annulohypoxylon truncatum]|uniref:kinase-like protein n=1 Tax=Annulohypoxylon truncatum TaxID=327061 RepID=UPI002008B4E9|nr:kinase-like protein [Annulohypoxylon truncatum]KAI1209658.1 kinase-like protein [Annulohypoxylon truncatum]
MQEDPERIQFPLYKNDNDMLTINWATIQKEQELAAGVYKILIRGKTQHYVFKEVDRPLYEPHDTEVLQQEFRNLVLLRNTKGIVQVFAAVISFNPYQTDEGRGLPVLRGFILEYHQHGSLRDILCSKSKMSYPWQRWAVQIAIALDSLHCRKLPHLDLKPANVVISTEWDAVLIDISGLAITQEWLSPEMRDVFAPWEQDVESRIQNDIWAFGKLLSRMADNIAHNEQ